MGPYRPTSKAREKRPGDEVVTFNQKLTKMWKHSAVGLKCVPRPITYMLLNLSPCNNNFNCIVSQERVVCIPFPGGWLSFIAPLLNNFCFNFYHKDICEINVDLRSQHGGFTDIIQINRNESSFLLRSPSDVCSKNSGMLCIYIVFIPSSFVMLLYRFLSSFQTMRVA